jgi:hypothetical protein
MIMTQEKVVEKRKQGHPTTFTQEMADRVCETIATHTEGLDKLHKKYDWFPQKQILFQWMFKQKAFYYQYLEARALQAHILSEQALEMANNIPTYTDVRGNEKIDPGMLGRERFRYECIKWHASKLAPKVFGVIKDDEDNKPDTLGQAALEQQRLLELQHKKDH